VNHVSSTATVQPSAELIRTMLPLVRRIAASFSARLSPSMSVDDLVSAGLLALVELQRRHGHLPVDELERLAAARLRGAMLDEMRQADPLSRRIRRRARQVEQVSALFEARHGRAPSDAEIGGHLGISATSCSDARVLARRVAVRAHDVDQEDVAGPTGGDPETRAHRGERLARFHAAVGHLPARQQQVVELYFGEDLTLRQIGEKFGVTEARISQILSGAVKELRTRCASVPPPAA
jgi:RNA polymerase sigma factor for flagellar operon FliA